jgi:hypothetical protein
MKTNRNLITKCLLVVALLPALAGRAQPTVSAMAAGAGFSLFPKSDGNLRATVTDGISFMGAQINNGPGAAFFKLQ